VTLTLYHLALRLLLTHRLPERLQDLPAQHVEEVGRRGAVDDDPVAVEQLAHGEVLRQSLAAQQGCLFVVVVVRES